MNIDNYIKHWAYLCESEEDRYNNQYIIEEDSAERIATDILSDFCVIVGLEKAKLHNRYKRFDVEFGGMSMLRKNNSEIPYSPTEECKIIFSNDNIDYTNKILFPPAKNPLSTKLGQSLKQQLQNKVKVKHFPKWDKNINHIVELAPGTYEMQAESVSIDRVKNNTFKIIVEFDYPTKYEVYIDNSSKYDIERNNVRDNITHDKKPLLPRESEEI